MGGYCCLTRDEFLDDEVNKKVSNLGRECHQKCLSCMGGSYPACTAPSR